VNRSNMVCWSGVVAGLIVFGGFGCGPSGPVTSGVSGTVSVAGKPVEGATVTFVPEKGAPVMGTTDGSGKFTIAQAIRGANKVSITKVSGGGAAGAPANPTPADMAKMAAAAAGKKQEQGKSEIPEKYGRAASSGLTAEVTSDTKKNVFSFDLKE